uniref:CAZy families CBM50 protein n=1 Tax=uncultured Listeria sp. TaxID=592375 RepID=A0A060C1N2_9LIST|nr:CAZy families CBM50 protein [uncultured Listeria sp.]
MPLGSMVFIQGYGYAIADDIGGSVTGRVIDVGVDSQEQAYQWGNREVQVYVVS